MFYARGCVCGGGGNVINGDIIMIVAERIVAYLKTHKYGTRPEFQRALGLCEKTVDTAIRRLEKDACICRVAKTEKIPKQKQSIVFAVRTPEINACLLADRRGRPPKNKIISAVKEDESYTLAKTMNLFFAGAK